MPVELKAVDAALDRVASRMTPIMQQRAVEAGWPEDVAARLSMVRTPVGIGFHFDGDPEVAADLEFGSASSGPRSVISSLSTAKMQGHLKVVSRDSMDELIARMDKVFS